MVAITQTMGNRSDTSSLLMFPLSLSFTHSFTELAICPSLQSVLMWMIYVITFWMFIVMLYSVLYSTLIYYPHTSATVNHLQALPPMQHTINSDSTQPDSSNHALLHNPRCIHLFFSCIVCPKPCRQPQLTSVQQSLIFSHT